jgi:hypothetical protein
MRFLRTYTDDIAHIPVVGTHGWDALAAMLTSGAAILEAETHYFDSSEVQHALAMGEKHKTR